jgi:tRNA dimethylallyltransferase
VAKPIVVILGLTASGKSKLAMDLARRFDGELICADSRTVYKGMDIGTAKPPIHDRKDITHHLLDVVTPDQPFSAAEFKRLAEKTIEDISNRGKLPIVVGGTGLYIDSLVFDFAFLPKPENDSREELNSLSISQLQQKIINLGIVMPENSENPRHLIRAIETNGEIPIKKGMLKNVLLIGIDVSREELVKRVQTRVDAMFEQGLESEAKEMLEKYGNDAPGLSAVGYREWVKSSDEVTVKDQITISTMQYAKRQRTWFKRNEQIKWVNQADEAIKLVQDFLEQFNNILSK